MKKTLVFTTVIIFYISRCFTTEKRRVELQIERFSFHYVDPEYIIDATSYVGRISRTSNYQLNFSLNVIRPWYNNVTISMRSFEFKDNRYKESFIRMSDKFCDALAKPIIWFAMPALQTHSNVPTKCPLVGHIFGKNFEVDLKSVPDNFPSSRWRFNYSFVQSPSTKTIFMFSVCFSFQEFKVRNVARVTSKGKF